jgi:hypothetical protein
VAVHVDGMLRGCPNNLIFLAGDGQRAVGLARHDAAIDHFPSHDSSSRNTNDEYHAMRIQI